MKLFPSAALATICILSGSAHAAVNIISGNLYKVPEIITLNAVPSNVPVTPPDVTFDVQSPFNFTGTGVTVATWLASSSAFNITENTPGTLASLMDNGITGTLLDFNGFVSVTNGQTFTVTHDDGLSLIIGGLDLNFNPGPTAPITSIATYTGPSGTFPFELVYTECCGGPAVLQLDLPLSNTGNVPEGGSTFALLMGSVLATGVAARRFRRNS
ncbi:MAG: hypothetical protein EOO05_22225 [Chitinophagaceae bacterium]|nr:MAG: hypothetical protein EOO05_22225 [Chitinophagaceae bacterium]